ncbi:MAG: DUF4097 family beta strand repeat-containing protein [Saprospiraceae bacterium]
MKKTIMLTLVNLLVFMTSASFAQNKVIDKTYQDIKKIEINVGASDLTVKKSGSQDTQVMGEYNEDQIEVIMQVNNGTLVIREKTRRNSHNEQSNWTLIVPEGMQISSNSGSGNIRIGDVALNLQANVGSGNFSFDKVGGNMQVNTGSGNIEINGSDAEFGCNTGSGNIEVSKSEGKFQLNTGSGQVSLQTVSGKISANTGSGDVNGRDIAITGHSGFNSGSGKVAVQLGSAPKADFSVNSGSGNSTLDFNGQNFDGELVMKCNKKSGSIAAPFRFDTEEEQRNGNNYTLRKTKKFGNLDIKVQVSTGSGQAKVIAP